MTIRQLPLTLCICLFGTVICPGEVVVVQEGEPVARIVLARDASEQRRAAAQVLANCVFESSGARLPIVSDDTVTDEHDNAQIHVGANRLSVTQNLLPAELDADGFVISAKGPDVVIAGASDKRLPEQSSSPDTAPDQQGRNLPGHSSGPYPAPVRPLDPRYAGRNAAGNRCG